MRIARVVADLISIPFRAPFGHSLRWRERTDTIIIRLESEAGVEGCGEILPRPYLTGETISRVLSDELPEIVNRWNRRSFENYAEILAALCQEQHRKGRALATRAGWELAVLDLAGKTFGFPAGQILGNRMGPELDGGVVIGFDTPTPRLEKLCMLVRLAGKRHIKVKVGRSDDLRRLQIVSGCFGPSIPLRIDANGAWATGEAVSQLRKMEHYNVCSVEEPVRACNLEGMREVRKKTGVAVVVDESLCSFADAQSIIAAGAADGFNIRVGKCGGFLSCMELVRLAKEAGLSCQLGTLVGETGILSRASEIFGERVEGFDFLEGKGQNRRLLQEDVVEPGPLIMEEGLGITVSHESLARWAMAGPKTFEGAQGVPT